MNANRFCKSAASGVLFILCLNLSAPMSEAADALKFWKNYFVTGDYVVGSVGLRGKGVYVSSQTPKIDGYYAKGEIIIGDPTVPNGSSPLPVTNGVPADVVAAFLYWQTDEPASAAKPSAWLGYFDGHQIAGDVVGDPNSISCNQPAAGYGRFYRADVLRHLPIDRTHNVRVANGPHEIMLRDGGPGNPFFTNGASLVLVYRTVVPGHPAAAPLKSVVIYDGTFILNKNSGKMEQTIAGFYQADQTAPSYSLPTKMTAVVGNGQPAFVSNVNVLTSLGPGSFSKPFRGLAGNHWDNPTFNIFLKANDSSYAFHVTADNSVCLNWGAIVSSTPVIDTDRDGLLDVWETRGLHLNTQSTPATFGGCTDYPAEPEKCVDLPGMGANPTKPDIFLEMDWLSGNDHVHAPKIAAINMVGDAFAKQGYAVHFDVGNNYQDNNYNGQPSPYIIRSGWGGGEVIPESALLCTTLNNNIRSNILPTSVLGKLGIDQRLDCAFPEDLPYPVLSFKRGFRSVKDGFPLANLPPRFDNKRKDIFRYVLFAHALATPQRTALGHPVSVSGVADKPGADILITLGLWRSDIKADDQTGSPMVQAGTLMHELGHNLRLEHASLTRTPNCNPLYFSQMNYLYQVRGFTDAQGKAHIGFSAGLSKALDEAALSEGTGSYGSLLYRIRYYDQVRFRGEEPSRLQCNGNLPGSAAIRVEMPGVSVLDWNRNRQPELHPYKLDVNFDGHTPVAPGLQYLLDSNDWNHVNLQQIGARLNANGLSVNVGSLDIGSLDIGSLDIGSLDIGSLDIGSLDIGSLDIGSLDIGSLDIGSLDIGSLDIGSLDIGSLDIGELDFDTFLSGIDPSNASHPLRAVRSIDRIMLDWGAPADTPVDHYEIYRYDATHPPALLDTVPGASALTYADGTKKIVYDDIVDDPERAGAACPNLSTCYNTAYTYYVIAVAVNNGETFRSATSTEASSEVNRLFVIADNQTAVYGDAAPSPTFQTYGHPLGTIPAISCAYPAFRNVGSYLIGCSGAATTSDPLTGVTYNRRYNDATLQDSGGLYLFRNPGVLLITRAPLTITAVPNEKIYDDTPNAAAEPIISALRYDDTVTGRAEKYDNQHAGTGKTLSVSAYTINDTNNGGNYSVTLVPNHSGVIKKAPLTITAAPNTKTYDATTTAAAPPIVSGLQGNDTATAIETYDSRHTGTGKTLTVSSYSVNDDNSGNNYVVTTVSSSAGTINPAPLTISAVSNSKTYDGNTSAAAIPIVSGLKGSDAVTGLAETYDNRNAGSGKTLSVIAYTVEDGNSGNNYTVTLLSVNNGVITPKSLTPAVTAADKVYDGSTSATITSCTLSGVIAGDTVTCSAASASFSDPNVGTKTVTATGITLAGPDAGDYVLSSTAATTTAKIKEASPTPTPAPAPASLVSWWRAENNALDSTGGNHGTLSGSVTFASGAAGQGFSFDGTPGTAVTIASASATNLKTPVFSVEAWVLTAAQPSDPSGGVIYGQSLGSPQLRVLAGSPGFVRLTFGFWATDGTFNSVQASGEVPLNRFKHIVGTYDGSVLRIYLNGLLSASSSVAKTPRYSSCPFNIGGFTSSPECGAQQFFKGIVDETSHYNAPLTSSEVGALYSAGVQGKVPPTP